MAESQNNKTVQGKCFCGEVRFSLQLPVVFCGHCHCTMCQRAHGAGFVTWIGALKSGFQLLGGEAHLQPYQSSDHGQRSFCNICGSTLFCESTKRPEELDIVLANLDDEVPIEPSFHIYFENRARFIHIDDDLQKFDGGSA